MPESNLKTVVWPTLPPVGYPLKKMRKTRFFQKDAYIAVDFLEKKVEVVKMKKAPENPEDFALILENAQGEKKQIYFENPPIEESNAILEELEDFARCHPIK